MHHCESPWDLPGPESGVTDFVTGLGFQWVSLFCRTTEVF